MTQASTIPEAKLGNAQVRFILEQVGGLDIINSFVPTSSLTASRQLALLMMSKRSSCDRAPSKILRLLMHARSFKPGEV